MGIKDLLKFMKPYIEPIHIKKYAGKRVGIDAYSWLHKGAYSCSMEICLNTDGDKKFQYLNYFMHRINLLRHHNIIPVVVFDGGYISCKAATGEERSRRRKANLDLAMEKLKEGNRKAASELFQRAVSITPSMANQLIQILRSEDIEFVVAPYEADAQLAYLSSLEQENGGIGAVISEDSDLLAYGCPAIVFKMDRYGNGEEILLHKVFESATCVPSFRQFDKELFIGMCVLAGCDFLPSVPGIGIAKAYSLVSKYRDLDRVLSMLKFEKARQMPEDYPESFRKAVAVFQHARIYDADSKSLKYMKPLPEKLLQSLDGDLDFLGPEIPPSIAAAIAKGNLDPTTMEAFPHFPSSRPCTNPSPKIQTFGTQSRQEATAVSKAESCFSIISSHRTGKEKEKVMGQKTMVEKSNYFNEATELKKLVCPSKTPSTKENEASTDKTPLKVPENNPFRKRKYAEIQLDELEIVTEQVLVVTELERSGTPESQQSADSSPIRAGDGSDISVVTDLERSRISFVTSESQQSIDSKPIRASDRSEISFVNLESHQKVDSKPLKASDGKKVKNEKLKRGNCIGLESKKSSILNFFSRV